MSRETRRGVKEGLGFGILAGIIFAVMEILGAAAMGKPPLMPVRMFASVVLGQSALEAVPLGTALLVGGAAHLVLSAVFGLIYGLINSNLPAATQTNWLRQILIGLGFGLALWVVNFQIIARALYPWFLQSPQLYQAVMHAVFFGFPLALMYAGAERHVRHAPTPA